MWGKSFCITLYIGKIYEKFSIARLCMKVGWIVNNCRVTPLPFIPSLEGGKFFFCWQRNAPFPAGVYST